MELRDISWTVERGGELARLRVAITVSMLLCLRSCIRFIYMESAPCPQALWAAIYLCLYRLGEAPAGLRMLGLVLARSRTRAPISMEFTFRAMQPCSGQGCGLTVLRFVSMLGDSVGRGSLKDSLANEIGHSDLVCDIRHHLTHKEMPEAGLVSEVKELLLEEIAAKYWHPNFERMAESLCWQQVLSHLSKMLGRELPEVQQLLLEKMPELTLHQRPTFLQSLTCLAKNPQDKEALEIVVSGLRAPERVLSAKEERGVRRIVLTKDVYGSHRRVAELWQKSGR